MISSVYRVNPNRKSSNFGAEIHPEALSNVSLNADAYQLHMFCLNQADDFRFYRKHLAKQFGVSIRTIQKRINRLKSEGLMLYHRRQNTMDAKAGFYVIFEVAAERLKYLREQITQAVNHLKGQAGQCFDSKGNAISKDELFRQVMDRLESLYELNDADRSYLDLVFNEWFDSLTVPARASAAFKWLENAYKKRRAEELGQMKMNQAKARKDDARSRQIEHEAMLINEKINPRAWDNSSAMDLNNEQKSKYSDMMFGDSDFAAGKDPHKSIYELDELEKMRASVIKKARDLES